MQLRLFIFILVIALGLLIGRSAEKFTSDLQNNHIGDHHATWSRSLFFRGYEPTSGEPLTEDNIETFASSLKNAGIRYAYLFSGPYSLSGRLPQWSYSQRAIESIKAIKQHYPEIKILPWVGGIEGQTVNVSDPAWRRSALKATETLIKNLPLDGLHVDFEMFSVTDPYLTSGIKPYSEESGRKYAKGVIDFHRMLKKKFPHLFVSSVVVSTATEAKPWKRKHTFTELKELYPFIDQLSFLFYDTSITDQALYEKSLLEQLQLIKELKHSSLDKDKQVLLGIGSFVNEQALAHYRDLTIENIPNTISVVKKGLKQVESSLPLVDGIALYCEWQTDKDEWAQFVTGLKQ